MSYAVYPLRHIGIGSRVPDHLFSHTYTRAWPGTRNAKGFGWREANMSDGLTIDLWKAAQDHILWVGALLVLVRLI